MKEIKKILCIFEDGNFEEDDHLWQVVEVEYTDGSNGLALMSYCEKGFYKNGDVKFDFSALHYYDGEKGWWYETKGVDREYNEQVCEWVASGCWLKGIKN